MESLVYFMPAVILLVAAIAAMFCAVIKSGSANKDLFFAISLTAVATLFQSAFLMCPSLRPVGESLLGFFTVSGLNSFLQFLVLLSLFVSLLAHCGSEEKNRAEQMALCIFIAIGAYFLVAARELASFYLTIEIISVTSYALVASTITSKRAAEAASKYFIQGAMGSAFILLGIVFLYGISGSLQFEEIHLVLADESALINLFAGGLVIVGMAFKLGLVPFHYWVADVYQAVPVRISLFLASVVKLAFACAAMTILSGVLLSVGNPYLKLIWVILALSIFVSNLLALRQSELKRLLAYSAIAHTAYFSVGLLEANNPDFQVAFYYYLVFYLLLTLTSFTAILPLEDPENHTVEIDRLSGLSKRSAFLAAVLTVSMLALSGLPPVLFGLISKINIIKIALMGNYIGLAACLLIGALIGCYYYFQVISRMYSEADNDLPQLTLNSYRMVTMLFLVGTILYYSVFPGRLHTYLSALILGS